MRFDPTTFWYKKSLSLFAIALLPLTACFWMVSAARRLTYRLGLRRAQRVHKPVIVVGNITAGGTGKTPFVIALAKELQLLGYKPGIISRGVGGTLSGTPTLVKSHHTASEVGDEALVIVRNSGCPMVIGRDRVGAAKVLLATSSVDVIISDDGLQHYRLARDIEIAMVDAQREFGNGYLIPSGPLREPLSRLKTVDYIVQNGGDPDEGRYSMIVRPESFRSVQNYHLSQSLDAFTGKSVHAVAGIGHPKKFFDTLASLNLEIKKHPFSDHFKFFAKSIDYKDELPVIMTEKDAVKCERFAGRRYWYLRIAAKIDNRLIARLHEQLTEWGKTHDQASF